MLTKLGTKSPRIKYSLTFFGGIKNVRTLISNKITATSNRILHDFLAGLKKDFLKYINNKSNKKNISKENLGECSICYENKSLKNTTCNHSFCYGCYQSWTSIKKECPMCRRPL